MIYRSHLLVPAILGLLAVLIVPQTIFAKSPDPNSVPAQLRIIRDTLAEMEGRLSQQLEGIQGDVNEGDTKLIALQNSVNDGNNKLDVLQESADLADQKLDDSLAALARLETANVDIKTVLCLETDVGAELTAGTHGAAGANWDIIAKLEASMQSDSAFGEKVGMVNTVCVEIPLYRVAALEQPLPVYDFDTSDFAPMLDNLADKGRETLPRTAALFESLMPNALDAVQTLENFNEAEPLELLAASHLLFENPPEPLNKLASTATGLLAGDVGPCDLIDMSPLAIAADFTIPSELDFLCDASSTVLEPIWFGLQALETMSSLLTTVHGWIKSMFGWVKTIFDWLP